MCTVSMVGDHYGDKFEPYRRQEFLPSVDPLAPGAGWPPYNDGPTKEEFNELKKDVEEMMKLLKRAKKYDEDNGEPDCETEEKMDFLRKIAKMVDVDLDEAFK